MKIKKTARVISVTNDGSTWSIRTKAENRRFYTYVGFTTEPKINGSYIETDQFVYEGEKID